MVMARLAYINMKRLLRHKGLRLAFVALPLAAAVTRVILSRNATAGLAAQLCPIACALLLAAVLYAQWSIDCASGLADGLRSCPTGIRVVAFSRVLSGLMILALQMAIFLAILAVRP